MGGPGHRGHGPGGWGGPGGPPDAVLKEAFGLTDAQAASLKTLRETRQASFESLQKQMADGRKALEESLKAEKPDAAKVGNALIAVRGYEKQMPKIEETFKTGFKALLNPEQKKKLAEIDPAQPHAGAGPR
jgi:Spy/CpxP family protein refolding chaperone